MGLERRNAASYPFDHRGARLERGTRFVVGVRARVRVRGIRLRPRAVIHILLLVGCHLAPRVGVRVRVGVGVGIGVARVGVQVRVGLGLAVEIGVGLG